LRDHFKLHSETKIQRIAAEWDQAVVPEFKMVQLLHYLHKSGVKLALLSNIGIEHANLIGKFWGSTEFYPQAVKHFSCWVGARKPNNIYYQSFLLDHPEFKGALYLDDLPENIATGKAYGLNGYQFALDTLTEHALDAHIEWIKSQLGAI
jgi:FMN phosphatase YigB (HAD superfamily)